ncbi:hypothetical protein [Pseudarthrobacter sp. H2]
MLAVLGDDGDVVGIGVGIDAGNDFQQIVCHDETALPLHHMHIWAR